MPKEPHPASTLNSRTFVPNIAHQHIVVLRKEPAGGRRQARARAER